VVGYDCCNRVTAYDCCSRVIRLYQLCHAIIILVVFSRYFAKFQNTKTRKDYKYQSRKIIFSLGCLCTLTYTLQTMILLMQQLISSILSKRRHVHRYSPIEVLLPLFRDADSLVTRLLREQLSYFDICESRS